MKRLAVIASGWHFPLHFFKAIAEQQIPAGWEVDLFCISHRDPRYSAEEKKEYLANLGWSYPETLDKVLYEKMATVQDIVALGWTYLLCPNTVGDFGNTNQWLEKYDYKQYDMMLISHDDNLILNDRLYVDMLTGHLDWMILTNSTGSALDLREFIKVKILGRAMCVRGSFEFIKTELFEMMGGKFDLTGVTLSREGKFFSPETFKTINNWNMVVVPMRKFLDQNNLARRIYTLSSHYRVSEYCIEGERGFVSSVQPSDKKSVERGLTHIQKIYNERLSAK